MWQRHVWILGGLVCLYLSGGLRSAAAVEVGLYNPYLTQGARISQETLVPTLRKWYLPQTLYTLYNWKGYEYTNYAYPRYERYVDTELEGDRFYDLYGNYILKGWDIYSWNQEYPQDFGSGIYKDPRLSRWFNNVVVSSSSAGQLHTALTVGEGIRTTMTPLTFSKPLFDGMQWDLLTDKYAFSVLASRVDNPAQVAISSDQGPSSQTIFTQLLGVRGTVDVGDFVTVGGTYLTVHHQNTAIPFDNNSLRGVLGGAINASNVKRLFVRLTDDSPEDGVGGALLLREQIFVDGVEHREIRPLVEGGVQRGGLIEASGANSVILTYDIEGQFIPGVDDDITDYEEIGKIDIGLVVANDYRIEVASNMQTTATGEPAYLIVQRAEGNITDGSNQRFVKFQYGLPTANELRGFTLDIHNVAGFNLKSEFVSNRRSRRFPNQTITTDQALADDDAAAFYVSASEMKYPFFAYGEYFSMDPDYATRMFIPDGQGQIDYSNEANYVYELVEDNDDQDRFPDWRRRHTGFRGTFTGSGGQFPDREVFPGLDENNDFISDFNQNQNNQPDWVEPFFRFHVDPPEFLFGTDMNNNTVIDRFENDTEADYPYKRDHQGYNAYVGAEMGPQSRLMAGRLREDLKSSERRSKSTYALLTLTREWPEYGLRIRASDMVRKVKDNIADDLIQWVEAPFSSGGLQEVRDPQIARDTFINTLYLEFDYDRYVPLRSKIKYETFRQLGDEAAGKRDRRFLGLINKAEYSFDLTNNIGITPQWKQTFASVTPTRRSDRLTRDLSEVFFLLTSLRISPSIWLGSGLEYEFFENLKKTPKILPPGFQQDFSRFTLGLQFSNNSDYLGYNLTSNIGFRWVRRSVSGDANTNAMAFVEVFAGLRRD
jgi:hypothetical protein